MKALNFGERAAELPLRRGTTSQPANVDKNLERLGWLMDDLFRIPVLGWRFGLDALIGLVPGLGDTTTALVSFYILAAAVRYRVPKITMLRMGLNIGIDYLFGSLPFVGDVADAWFKSNQKNLDLLRRRATVSAEEAREGRISDWLFVGGIIVGLAALAIASATISFYLLLRIGELLAGN
ncbi:MAG TPA: DUF4112 domain-containing protein [Pyrinomonadaceae bacterium]|nr:DUF4112 domain-containing protein [Pyrinomonadaceae bacterium]